MKTSTIPLNPLPGLKMADLTHFDSEGNARMVDVSGKEPTERIARASGRIQVKPATADAIRAGAIGKGDVLQVARLAGIMAAKKTPDLIPLCHTIAISSVEIEFEVLADQIIVVAAVVAVDRTGAEMEALTAASVAALTIYDMCKSIDRGMTIENICVDEKSGGRSGHFVRQGNSNESADS